MPTSDYEVLDLGVLPGSTSEAPAAINNRGTAILTFYNAAPYPLNSTAGVTDAGRVVQLGGLAGFPASSAGAINDYGLAVGTAIGPPLNAWMFSHTHAVLFTPSGTKDLGTLPGDTESGAAGINNAGDAVGYSMSVSSRMSATLFRNGRTIRLGDGYGVAINNSGLVIGTGDNGQATLFSRQGTRSLGTLAGPKIPSDSYGVAINDRGVAVGYSSNPMNIYPWFFQHAFMFDAGGMHDLGVPAGADFKATQTTAYAINDLNEIVGYYIARPGGNVISNGGPPTAFLYASGRMRDLNSLLEPGTGWILESAVSINTCGDIVGQGIHAGKSSAFLLRRRQLDQVQLRLSLGCRR